DVVADENVGLFQIKAGHKLDQKVAENMGDMMDRDGQQEVKEAPGFGPKTWDASEDLHRSEEHEHISAQMPSEIINEDAKGAKRLDSVFRVYGG
ncbi:hypothetical protein KI387_037298, partial [Taxus chinensis]